MSRQLDNWLNAYMEYTRHLEAPDRLHFWSGVATLAGALRGKCWIDMGYFKWRPNFFIIMVAPPGIATKSTTISVGMELLRSIEGIHFGPDSVTWQALTTAFAESTTKFELPGEEEPSYMSPITVAASELGTFFDPKNREMVDVLVDLWDGRDVPWKRKTKHEGDSNIPHPWFNFIGATTPSWIADNFTEYSIGGGFTSRTVFLFADSKRKFTAYPNLELTANDDAIKALLVQDLTRVAGMAGEFKLTEAAYGWGTDWYKRHWLERPSHLKNDRLAGYIARKQTHLHKIAMILSAAQSDDMVIDQLHLEAALAILEPVEENYARAFERIDEHYKARVLTSITILLKGARAPVEKAELWRIMSTRCSFSDFDEAIDGALHAGYITLVSNSGKLMVAPTKLLYERGE